MSIETQLNQFLTAEDEADRRALAIDERADELDTAWRDDPAALAAILDEWRGESDANEAAYQTALDASLYSAPAGDPAGAMRQVLSDALEKASIAEATKEIDQEDRESQIDAELTRRELRPI